MEGFFDYFKKKLYTREVEHFGQEVMESVTAKLQIGMAKKTRMRIMSIQSESFFPIVDSPLTLLFRLHLLNFN